MFGVINNIKFRKIKSNFQKILSNELKKTKTKHQKYWLKAIKKGKYDEPSAYGKK